MNPDNLTEELKTRVKPAWHKFLVAAAQAENLRISDIVRRAIYEYITRRQKRGCK